MIYDFEHSKEFLRSEFETRVRKNPRYSLRSFAQYLNIHPAELSQIFSGKRNLSLPSAEKVSVALGLSADESRQLFLMLQKERGRQLGLNIDFEDQASAPNLSEENFTKISQWFHFAILNLIDTKDFQWSARHISKRLGIALSQADIAMRDLQRMGQVQVNQNSKKKMVVASSIPSAAIRKYHQQMLERASVALSEVPLDRREYQSIGFVTKLEDLPQLKKDVDDFTNKIIKKFHRSQGPEVYQLQVCLFPLTKESQS